MRGEKSIDYKSIDYIFFGKTNEFHIHLFSIYLEYKQIFLS